MWETKEAFTGSAAADALECAGWEPFSCYARPDYHLAASITVYRRRLPAKPQPLLPCAGCKWVVVQPPVETDDGAMLYDAAIVCRRYPTIKEVDGLGCGERQ